MTGLFLSVSRVLPNRYPLKGELEDYIAGEHAVGRLLDLGVIVPRFTELYRWSAEELRIPDVADLVCDATPAYAWDPHDRDPWAPPPRRLVRAVRRALPPSPRPRGLDVVLTSAASLRLRTLLNHAAVAPPGTPLVGWAWADPSVVTDRPWWWRRRPR